MKHFAQGLFASLLFSALGIFSTGAQNVSKTLQLDSTVTVSANGEMRVSYSAPVFDYGAPIKVSEAEKLVVGISCGTVGNKPLLC